MATLLTVLAMVVPADDLVAQARHEHAQHSAAIRSRRALALARARRNRDPRPRIVRPYRWKLTRMARCESGGRWFIATGNGFYGGLQFTASTWWSVGGRGLPHHNSKLEQMYRAVLLIRRNGGYGDWPVCGYV